MRLSEKQEQKVIDYVQRHRLKLHLLGDDLIDHLCCRIENDLRHGQAFEQSMENALAEVAPNGIGELQKKTLESFNSKGTIMLKKVNRVFGILGALGFFGGFVFKALSYPGYLELFTVGYLFYSILFFPLLVLHSLQLSYQYSTVRKLKLWLGMGASLAMGFAGIFKIMHLQGASLLLLSGMVIFILGFLPFQIAISMSKVSYFKSLPG